MLNMRFTWVGPMLAISLFVICNCKDAPSVPVAMAAAAGPNSGQPKIQADADSSSATSSVDVDSLTDVSSTADDASIKESTPTTDLALDIANDELDAEDDEIELEDDELDLEADESDMNIGNGTASLHNDELDSELDSEFGNNTMDVSIHARSSQAARAGCVRLFTGDVIRLSGRYRHFLEPLPATLVSKDPVSALVSWERKKLRQQLFEVTVVNARKAIITLRSVATKKYLHTDTYHFGLTFASMGATASQYKVVRGRGAGKIRLQDAQTGQFLVAKSYYGTFYEFSKRARSAVHLGVTFVYTRRMKSVIVSACVVLRQGARIGLRTTERTYFKRFYPFPRKPYSGLAAYRKRPDSYSRFTVIVRDRSRVYLRAENRAYLKRFCCWKQRSVIATIQRKVDRYSLFRFRALRGSRVFMITENNQFVTLWPKSYGRKGAEIGASVVSPKPNKRLSTLQVIFF